MNTQKWGHDELAHDLALHLRGLTDRVVWEDMQLGPAGSPRPDVYTIPKSFTKFTPVAYECKISVSDFRRDITSGKWQSYLEFAAAVIFAVPAGLVTKADVPTGCGLIIRNENGWKAVKGPTMQRIPTLPHAAWMKLMIDGLARQKKEPSVDFMHEYRAQKKIKQRYGDELARALADRDGAKHSLERNRLVFAGSLENERKHYQERIDQLRANAASEESAANTLRRELAAVLGLPESASIYSIKHEAAKVRERLSEAGEIAHLRSKLESARRHMDSVIFQLEKGLEATPLERVA